MVGGRGQQSCMPVEHASEHQGQEGDCVWLGWNSAHVKTKTEE